MKVTEVLPVGIEEADDIAAIVRQADHDELVGALELDLPQALRMAFGGSIKARKIVVDGLVVAVYGDAYHDQGIGVPWLISTIHVEESSRQFVKACRLAVADMLTRHNELRNFVDVRNDRAIKWLKSLGFMFGDPIPYGPKGMPFYPFSKHRSA